MPVSTPWYWILLETVGLKTLPGQRWSRGLRVRLQPLNRPPSLLLCRLEARAADAREGETDMSARENTPTCLCHFIMSGLLYSRVDVTAYNMKYTKLSNVPSRFQLTAKPNRSQLNVVYLRL